MRKAILPVIVTTHEALLIALDCKCRVIYLDDSFYEQDVHVISSLMSAQGYILRREKGLHGVFYLNTTAPNAFNPLFHKIHDPNSIL